MFLTQISLKRPVFATVIIIALLALGLVSYTSLPVEQFPGVDIPYVAITIVEYGAAPDQLESKVTKKIEDTVGQISGVSHMTSTIREGVSTTLIEFELEKPSDQAMQEVSDKISSIRGELPRDINEPIIMKYDMTASAVASLAVTGDMSNLELSQLVEDDIVKKLNKTKTNTKAS